MPKLTEISIRALKPPEEGQTTIWDDLPGFGIRLSQGGTKTFILLHGRDRQRTTIGRYPIISLSQARDAAKRILAEKTLGQHQPKTITFGEVQQLFLEACESKCKPRTVRDYTRLLERHFKRFKNYSIGRIETDDLMRTVDRLANTPAEQNHTFTAARAMLRFAVKRRLLRHSPLEGLTTPAKLPTRDRLLTDKEITAIWGKAKGDFGAIVKLCLLTGQRRSEIGSLTAEMTDTKEKTVTLPERLTKNNREHTFPYGDMAQAIFETLPKEGYLFPSRSGGYGNWSNGKRLLETPTVPSWTLHDLRRTFATNLAALKVAPHVLEAMLNHVSGTISGVALIYNRHRYLEEMRVAIELWEKKLATILKTS